MTIRTLLLSTVAAFALAACGDSATQTGGDQPAAQAQNAQQTPELKIEYEKFTLGNGLEVILQVDRSDPIVAVTTVIHAGSNREKPGRTGFAHFFEHMAFNDSENVPRGWNRKAIPDWGGQRNGGTWSDGTIYYEVVPKDAFDKILWIDSDRLGYMINTVTPAALGREKQVVKNEKRQRVDNAVYGYTGEVIRKALYPEGHPYNWTVIGALPDLQAATLGDLREFHKDWYGPNNVTLSIVGDIDIEETKRKVTLWFGEIPRGRDVAKPAPQAVMLTETKNLWFEDNFAKLPELRLTFPTVQGQHADEVALDMLAAIFGGSRNSPLYVEVVESAKLAPNVAAYHRGNEIAGEFTLRVRAKPGTDLDDVKASIDAAMARFESGGVDATDLERIKAESETRLYNSLSTVLGKSNDLATNNEFYGDPAYSVTAAQKVRAMTAQDIMAAYNRYIKAKPYVMTSFVPKGGEALAVQGAERATVWIEEVQADVASEAVSAGDVAEFDKTATEHDRSEPDFGELPLLKMPEIWTRDLGEGVMLRGIETDEIPLVQFDITLPGGRWSETADQNGRLSLLADLMNEGTANRTPAQLEQAVGLLGSSINVSAGSGELTISVTALARNFEPTVALVQEVLTQPRWQAAEFERVKSASLTGIKGREANPNSIASQAFYSLVYGDDHPLGRPSGGSAQTVGALNMDDLKTAHAGVLSAPARLHIVGDIDPDRAAKGLSGLAAAITASGEARPGYDIPAQDNAGRVFFINVPGSKQSVLRIGKLTAATADPDFNKIVFTNEKLGGGISGDLSQILRIEKGYTYGAYSSVQNGEVARPFIIGTSVRANATKASLETIRDMIIAYGPDFDDADVAMTQQKLIKENTRAFESLGAKQGTLRNISKYGLLHDYVEQQQAELLAMSRGDFQNTAAKYLSEDDMIYVIVGDKATQWRPVQQFAKTARKGKVVELDIYGQPVK
ncbi:M16 family metallopeptidase [Robiginitomaculum antarcticum]|uniref:M16 family metallopeptidase n=1 Tax=Robiginitomaculum antarcticum TaxID=437507 RepID=UPI0003825A50|nr:pitrilysin family protein [Robiginitomaculum antarcticum]